MTFLLNSLLISSLALLPVTYDPEKRGEQLRVGDFILKYNYVSEESPPTASSGDLLCADNKTIVAVSEEEMNGFIQPIWKHNEAQEWKNLKQYGFSYFYQVDELPDDVVMSFYQDPNGNVKKVFTFDLVEADGLAQKVEGTLRAKCDQANST